MAHRAGARCRVIALKDEREREREREERRRTHGTNECAPEATSVCALVTSASSV
jgi:hypothetical protein